MIEVLATAVGGFLLGWLVTCDFFRRRQARMLALPPARIIRGDVVAREQRGACVIQDCECGLGGGRHVHVHSWRAESRPRVVRVPLPPWLPGPDAVAVPVDVDGRPEPIAMPIPGEGVAKKR
jgi:hypothetical protein